jgi:hypothetical protein
MRRASVAADVFGYIVCLIAVLIFFASVAGIVNNAFRIAHPMPGMLAVNMVRPVQPQTPLSPEVRRAHMLATERYDAARGLVLAIVMLILSIAVFRRTFEWLNAPQPAS